MQCFYVIIEEVGIFVNKIQPIPLLLRKKTIDLFNDILYNTPVFILIRY